MKYLLVKMIRWTLKQHKSQIHNYTKSVDRIFKESVHRQTRDPAMTPKIKCLFQI
jgi:hypothetical protein